MDNREIHKKIWAKFGINNKRKIDNLPFVPRSRGRAGPTRITLAELLGEMGYNKCVEVGVAGGTYSEILCKNNPNIELACVDFWEPYIHGYGKYSVDRQARAYKSAINKLSKYNVQFLKMSSMDALKHFKDKSLDFVYVDANHTFDHTAMDIICWSKKLRPGGIMGCHDYYHFRWSGVVEAVDAYVKCHNIVPWYVIKGREPTAFWVKPLHGR